jgi:hypothetical protein
MSIEPGGSVTIPVSLDRLDQLLRDEVTLDLVRRIYNASENYSLKENLSFLLKSPNREVKP